MKNIILTLAASAALSAATAAAGPSVSGVTMTQADDRRLVTIAYTLADAPAIVTLDVQTNRTGAATGVAADWVSVGGEALWAVSGDVWKKVSPGSREIAWKPGTFWRGQRASAARAVVTAWPTDNPPDYLVADLSDGAAANSERYYPSAAFLPGGLLANEDYRRTRLVMRKIPAKGVTWTMGSATDEKDFGRDATAEKQHDVTMGSNYYLGVFAVTQEQWWHVWGMTASPGTSSNNYFYVEGAMRPAEWMTYYGIRSGASEKAKSGTASCEWPNDPNPESFLGRLRTKTGLKFDLPTEAQWEFACRAGTGSGCLNDGSAISAENIDRLGRIYENGGYVAKTGDDGKMEYSYPAKNVGADQGTAIVGSFEPNAWGLYDMHGNVWEYCLDWFVKDVSSLTDGLPNIDPIDPSKPRTGTATQRVRRGGSWGNDAYMARSAYRLGRAPDNQTHYAGFRLALPVGE